jgi:hypothetical protein
MIKQLEANLLSIRESHRFWMTLIQDITKYNNAIQKQ